MSDDKFNRWAVFRTDVETQQLLWPTDIFEFEEEATAYARILNGILKESLPCMVATTHKVEISVVDEEEIGDE